MVDEMGIAADELADISAIPRVSLILHNSQGSHLIG